MIKKVKLTEVADIFPTPQKDKIYPQGTILIQTSASKGQVLYLKRARTVDNRYLVILPKIEPIYLFCAIQKYFPSFFNARKQGINFRGNELAFFTFPIHTEKAKREEIAKTIHLIGGISGE